MSARNPQMDKIQVTMDREEENARDLSLPFPIIRMLLQEGYLKDDEKWLTSRGFSRIGNLILDDVMKALKLGEAGAHGTKTLGTGFVVLDTTRKYEDGNDIRLVNIPLSLLNCVLRTQKEFGRIRDSCATENGRFGRI